MKKRLLSMILALCMILTMMPAAAFATDGGNSGNTGIEIDKTATALNSDDRTTVTLNVGGDEAKEKVAVLFVLDYSTSVNVRNAAANMLDELSQKENTNIKTCVINYWANADSGKWVDITSETDTQELLNVTQTGGTNYHAGLLAAEKALESPDIEGYETYLITISDGITYLWTDDTADSETFGETMSVWFQNVGNGPEDIQNGNSVYEMKYNKNGSIPDETFESLVNGSADTIIKYNKTVEKAEVYSAEKPTSEDTGRYWAFEDEDVKSSTLIGSEIAIYKTAQIYREICSHVDHAYAFKLDENHWDSYPYGEQLMDYLISIGEGGEITNDTAKTTFGDIRDQILYTIKSGTVTDIIGVKFDLTDAGNINNDTFKLTVGGQEINASSVDDDTVCFGTETDGIYPYSVTYKPDDEEKLIWDINVPVEQSKPLELKYSLDLVEKETDPGIYNVETNESAVLEYESTDGTKGTQNFPVPKVSYTVQDSTITPPSWDVSKSKTATNLDANYESDVTLALPAADYERTMDVVFVIDDTHAGSTIFEDAVDNLLNELAEKDTMNINVGIVAFDAVSRDWLSATSGKQYSGLVSLKDDGALEALKTAVSTQLNYDGTGYTMKVGGTNTEWAVDMAHDMLAKGSGEEKYLIMFSDLYGYIYRGDLTIDSTTYSNVPVSKRIGQWNQGSMSMGIKYDSFTEAHAHQNDEENQTPDGFFRDSSWVNYWSIYGNVSAVPDNTIASEYQVNSGTFSGFEKSLCLTYDNLKEAAQTAHVIVVNNSFPTGDAPEAQPMVQEMLDQLEDDGAVKTYRYATNSAGDALSGEAATGVFDGIREDLIQLVDAGSEVVDVIGNGEDENGVAYDFDFINDISNLKLTVNGTDLNVESIASQDGATASYGFGKTEAGGYQFVLNYYQNGTATQSGEHFVWKINVPVTKDAPVQLTYSVKLTNPQTSPGTYGKYDADGSENYNGLLTNNSATLYPVDSNGEDGMEEVFSKPTVSYEVTGPIEISPADITIYMGGAGYDGTVNESGELGDDGQIISENGFPEPGFTITLPETLKDIDIDDLQLQYKDGGIEYNWEFEMYGPGEHEIYRIVPSEGTAKRPVRMQFTKTVDGEEITVEKDEFTFEENLNETLTMKVYGEGIEEEKVRFIYNGKEYPITVGEGELTVRGTTGNVQYGQLNQEINESNPGLSAPEDTLYYINGSAVQVETAGENKADIALLFDDIIENGSGEENTQLLQDRADEVLKESDVLTGSGTRHYESKYLDLVDTNNGNAWLSSSEPVTVYWPLPDNTTENTKFEILHFTGMHREMGTDYIADAIENCVVETVEIKEVTDSHIVFDVDPLEMDEEGNITSGGFSPFMLIWETEESSGGGGGGSSTPELNKEDHFAYIIGYPVDYRTGEATEDKSLWPVKPQNNITRAEVATIFFRMLTDESRSEYWKQSNSYSDVDGEAWYNNAVSTLSNAGILTGYEDGSFRPNDPISRAEFATISARFSDVEFDGSNNFSDVPDSYWAAKYIALAEYLGWIDGYPDGTFKPDQNITRAESMKLVNEVLDRTPDADQMLDEMIKWPDNDENAWYYADVQEATNSHEYQRKDSNSSEKWTSILEVRDWAELERQWSDANSSENPGNVMR